MPGWSVVEVVSKLPKEQPVIVLLLLLLVQLGVVVRERGGVTLLPPTIIHARVNMLIPAYLQWVQREKGKTYARVLVVIALGFCFSSFLFPPPKERKAIYRNVGETTTEAIDTEQEWLGSGCLSWFPNWGF